MKYSHLFKAKGQDYPTSILIVNRSRRETEHYEISQGAIQSSVCLCWGCKTCENKQTWFLSVLHKRLSQEVHSRTILPLLGDSIVTSRLISRHSHWLISLFWWHHVVAGWNWTLRKGRKLFFSTKIHVNFPGLRV